MKLWKLTLLVLTAVACAPALAGTAGLIGVLEDARSAIRDGRHDAAISRLESWPEGSEQWEIQFWLGTAYLMDGRLDAAADALDLALMLEAGLPEIWVQRAVVEQERGRPEAAVQLLEVAAELDPGYALTWLNVGLAYESLGDAARARGAYGRFLKLAAVESGSSRLKRLRRDVLNRLSTASRSS